jgi:hypothetical protein
LRAAIEVPAIDATLLVPNSVAGVCWGSAVNRAGTWISPPPPTTASMKPAPNAHSASTTTSDASSSRAAASSHGWLR